MWELVDLMRDAGLARSDREVSRVWLCRAPNYLSDRQGKLSAETALRLYLRLRDRGHSVLAAQVWERAILPLALHAKPDADSSLPQSSGLRQQRNTQT
jgi:hypothetical protein